MVGMDDRARQRIVSRLEEIKAEKARLSSEGMNPQWGLVHVSEQLHELDEEERTLRRSIGEDVPEERSRVLARSWQGWAVLTVAITGIVVTLWLVAELGP